ncbi:tetratricopeptide repeat protein [Pyxidicoccus trucidator]|uniref:tetratricopeptide repeat protein n=1 Tax=Pyxidicoccus trucidator TaxID=2709662 RepID=UPI0013D98887|nr:tetratricopeptide repeat protein [Pyxidicoccus trucidator]
MNEPRQRAETLLAQAERLSPGLGLLAEVLSLAVRVEPALLRKARLVFAPKLGVGVEADLWFGQLVESSGAGGFVFRREVAELLRERLARNPARLDAAWRLTRSFHPFIPPAAALEEKVTWAALAGHSEEALNRELGSALTAMLSSPSRAVGIARWALRALPRLPERAQRSETGALLSLATISRVDGTWLRVNGALPARLPARSWRVLDELSGVPVRLLREPERISFLPPEAQEGHRLELPDTHPPLLELAWEEAGQQHRTLVAAEPGAHVPLPGAVERLQFRAVNGQRWELTTVLEQETSAAPSFATRARVFLSPARLDHQSLRTILSPLIPEVAFAAPPLVGDTWSSAVGESLLDASVVIVVAGEAYWTNEFSRRELRIALLPYTRLPSKSTREVREAALEHIIVVSADRDLKRAFQHLPIELRNIQWPRADDVNGIAALIRMRLASKPPRIRERLRTMGVSDADIQDILWEAWNLPPREDLGRVRHHPVTISPLLGETFVGRASTLWQLDDMLTFHGPSRTVLVEGGAGVGKTRFALEYLQRFGPSSYPGGVFWVDASVSDDQLEARLHGILRVLRPKAPELESFLREGRNVRRELAGALREEGQRARILYVVDDIPTQHPERRSRPLSWYCPSTDFIVVLATLRDAGAGYGVSTKLQLDVLDSNAAVALLTYGIESDRQPQETWKEIADQVGNLPLALTVLNASLRAGNVEPESLLARLKKRAVEFLDEQASVLSPGTPSGFRSVVEEFTAIYEELSEQAKWLARVLAQFAPTPIPVSVFEATDANLIAITPVLAQRGLISMAMEEGIQTLRLNHPLLAGFLRDRFPDATPELMRICQGLLTLMNPDSQRELTRWPVLRACLPHAQEVFKRLGDVALPELDKARFVELGVCVGQFLLTKGDLSLAWFFAGEAHEHAAEALGADARVTLDALGCMAAVERAEGNYSQSRYHCEQRLSALRESIRSTSDPALVVALMDLGAVFFEMDDLKSARIQLELALDMSRHIHEGRHPQTAVVMTQLAEVLQHAGDHRSARALLEDAIATLHQSFGFDHLDTLIAESQLAATLVAMGEPAPAHALEERVVSRFKEFLGEEHLLTRGAMGSLADILESLGQKVQARELRARLSAILLRGLQEVQGRTSSFPPPPSDVELQELLSDRLYSGETPGELLEMGNVQITSVDVTWDQPGGIVESRRLISGGGQVGVDLMVGDDSLAESFPFDFTVEQHADGSLTTSSLTVDTSTFYGEQDVIDPGESEGGEGEASE